MAFNDFLLPEFDHEMGTTRRLLERVPDAAARLEAARQVDVDGPDQRITCRSWPRGATVILTSTSFDLATMDPKFKLTCPPSQPRRSLDTFDSTVKAARAELAAKTDAEYLVPWTLKHGSHEMFTLPRFSARAQLRAESHHPSSRAVERLPPLERRGAALDLRPHCR